MILVTIAQGCSHVLPQIRKNSQKSAKKLQQISFDTKPNKLISEQKRNMYKIFCGEDDKKGYATMHCSPDTIVNLLEC